MRTGLLTNSDSDGGSDGNSDGKNDSNSDSISDSGIHSDNDTDSDSDSNTDIERRADRRACPGRNRNIRGSWRSVPGSRQAGGRCASEGAEIARGDFGQLRLEPEKSRPNAPQACPLAGRRTRNVHLTESCFYYLSSPGHSLGQT